MTIEWSGSASPGVLLTVDRQSSETLGSQLQRELRAAIQQGRLRGGERLPSSRRLAADLGVSRGLVQATYEQLESEGYLRAVGGSGTRVALSLHVPTPSPSPQAAPADVAADFTPGVPDLRSFPVRDWLWASGEAIRSSSASDMAYGDPRGVRRLREVVAAYLQRVRGTCATADDVLVCGGFTQGAALTLQALRKGGVTRVAVEDPGHPAMPTLVRNAGLQPIPVPVDDNGILVDRLAGSGATAVILTPAHQTPTGAVLTADRRLALVRWADHVSGTIIEDDYDSEFRYDKQAVGCLQGLMPDRVVTIGSVSKTLAPGVRLGWVLAPGRLMGSIADHKQHSDRHSPALDQLALARLMESGRFDRHLRRMRGVYADRRAALVSAVGEHAPHLVLTGLEAGFHALARLPRGTDERAILDEAWRRSVRLQGLARYQDPSAGDQSPGIVFGFGNIRRDAIGEGVRRIADLL